MVLKSKSYQHIVFCFAITLLCLLLDSCIADQSAGPIGTDSELPNLTHNGFWIANEGGFTLGQASLSFLDLAEDTIYNDVFRSINQRPLGDVLQSISYYNGRAYLLINNSNKIEVVDSITFESIATINNLNSPRELIGFKSKLFITSLYSNYIEVVNESNYLSIEKIETNGWNDKMLIYGNQLIVTQQQIFINNIPGNRKGLWIYNAVTHDSISFIDLAQGANSMALDKDNKLWVICDGGLEEEVGAIYQINPLTHQIEKTIQLPSIEHSASSIQMDEQGESFYFIQSDPNNGINAYDIMKLSINDSALPNQPFYDGGQLYIYGFHVDETNQELYFNDAVGLIQEGFCYRIDMMDQSILGKYKTGIFPSKIYSRY